MGGSTAKTGSNTSGSPTKENLGLTDAYLLLYNTACAVGWNLTMYKIGTALLEGGGVRDAVGATHDLVVALQLLSTLELVHAFVGLVRGMKPVAACCVYCLFNMTTVRCFRSVPLQPMCAYKHMPRRDGDRTPQRCVSCLGPRSPVSSWAKCGMLCFREKRAACCCLGQP